MKYKYLLLLFLLLGACQRDTLNWEQLNTEIKQTFPAVEHISIDELSANNNKNTFLVDVRADEEYAVSHIPGALNLTNPKTIAKLAQQSKKNVVVYCSVGYRSAIMANELKKLGITNVKNLEGSIFAWANAGLPLINQSGNTREVHPYDEYWGQLLVTTAP
jgi:rhodanese-related sulfurtransferase